MENIFYTVDQICEILSLHSKTVQRYIREGKLRAVKLGKGWRVSSHDLSTFIEHNSELASDKPYQKHLNAMISAVADIPANTKDDAISIMNTLTAALNSKPAEYGESSMQLKYIPLEQKVRATLRGGSRFISAIVDSISILTENDDSL